MNPILQFSELPKVTSSGKAYIINMLNDKGNQHTEYLPVSHCDLDGDILSVSDWLLEKADVVKRLKLSYTVRNATNILTKAKVATVSSVAAVIQKGFFTIAEIGKHRTYRVRTYTNNNNEEVTVIGKLFGSDNRKDYETFAYVKGQKLVFFRNCRFPRELMQSDFNLICGDPNTAGTAYALESNNCCRCGRPLTVPASIENALRPVCDKMGSPFAVR